MAGLVLEISGFLFDLIMFFYFTLQGSSSTAFKNDYLACDKSRSRVINMRKPSSLKRGCFHWKGFHTSEMAFHHSLIRIYQILAGLKRMENGLPVDPKYSHIFKKNMPNVLCSFKIWSHKYWSHRLGDKRSFFNILACLNCLTLAV